MGFVAPVLGAVGGALGLSGTAATVGGAVATGLGAASAFNRDVRRIALPVLGGMAGGAALGGLGAGAGGSCGVLGVATACVSHGALMGGVMGADMANKMNQQRQLVKTQQRYYDERRNAVARQEAAIRQQEQVMNERMHRAKLAQQSALNLEAERMARYQRRALRGRRRGLLDSLEQGDLAQTLG